MNRKTLKDHYKSKLDCCEAIVMKNVCSCFDTTPIRLSKDFLRAAGPHIKRVLTPCIFLHLKTTLDFKPSFKIDYLRVS